VAVIWPSAGEFADDLRLFVREYNSGGFPEPIPVPTEDQVTAAAAAVVAVNEPVFGKPRFRTLNTKCAAAFYELSKRHFFVNGNKRVATFFLLHLLEINGQMLRVSPKRLATFAERVAASHPVERERLVGIAVSFIRRHRVELTVWRPDTV
jgi:death-on-curing family protein